MLCGQTIKRFPSIGSHIGDDRGDLGVDAVKLLTAMIIDTRVKTHAVDPLSDLKQFLDSDLIHVVISQTVPTTSR